MKVALVGPTHPFRGGISHYTTLLYRHLRAAHETRFYTWFRQYPDWLFPGRGDRDPSAEGLREPGAEAVLDGFNPLTFAALGARLRRERPDVLLLPWWVTWWAPHYLALTSLARARLTLFLVHNVFEHEDHAAKRAVTRAVLRRGDRFLVHSREDEERLLSLLPDASVVRVFHPTYEELAPALPDRDEARRRIAAEAGLPLDDGAPLVLFFGFVRPYKGLPDLVDALPRMASGARLLVVGEFWGETRAELERQIAARGLGGRVVVIDRYVPNEHVGVYFAAADVVALPYRSGSGSGILQMAFGFRRPVVATRVGSLADAVRPDRTGVLVPPRDPAALAAGLDRVLALRDRVPFAQHIEADVRDRFSWAALVRRIEWMAAPVLR